MFTRLCDDESLYFFTVYMVRDTHDSCFCDCWVPQKNLLNFHRRDVLSASDNDILLAAGDVEVAVLVHISQVAGIKPTGFDGLGCFLRQVPVAFHQCRSLDHYFALLPWWKLLALLVEHFYGIAFQ